MTRPKRKWRKLGVVTGRDKNKKNLRWYGVGGIHHVQVPAVSCFFIWGGVIQKNRGNPVEVHHLFIPFHKEPPHLNRKKLIRDSNSNQWEMRFLLEGRTSIKAIRSSFQNGTPPKQQKPLGNVTSQSSPKGAMKGATESNWKQLLSGFVLVASTWKNFPRPQYQVWVNWLNSC